MESVWLSKRQNIYLDLTRRIGSFLPLKEQTGSNELMYIGFFSVIDLYITYE